MSQIHLNAIKICIVITLALLSGVVFYFFYLNYNSMQNVDRINEEIKEILADNKDSFENQEKIEPSINNNNEIIEKPIINKELESLLEINKDTVGWLKVNNTNIDYPVVQTTDNDYYLNKNFKHENDKSGWIFMDYRANIINLSQNTIIFGHNMYYSGVMFGTLYKVKSESWYKNPDNQIIEFNTLYQNMQWQIFSIYVIDTTNDYLIADFSSEEKFQEFLDLITKRSIYNFNTPVSNTDKMLTLSTCSNNGTKRLVIHAVLLSDN